MTQIQDCALMDGFVKARVKGDFKMEMQELEAKIKALESEVATFKDIEAIRRLQKSYGYYAEHLMVDELTELWADDGELQWIGWGSFKGKEKIKTVWTKMRKDNPAPYI
jgi:hypothetical protein